MDLIETADSPVPPGARVDAVTTADGVRLRVAFWPARGQERRGTVLLDAVAAMALVPEGLYAYGAGESRLVTSVRKHLRQERGLPGPQVQMVGYWRRGS